MHWRSEASIPIPLMGVGAIREEDTTTGRG